MTLAYQSYRCRKDNGFTADRRWAPRASRAGGITPRTPRPFCTPSAALCSSVHSTNIRSSIMSDSRQPRPSASEPTASRDPTNYQASDDALSASKSLRALVAHLTAPPPVPRLPPVSDSPNVTFTYTPGFPNFGPQQKAIGILAQTREVGLPSVSSLFGSTVLIIGQPGFCVQDLPLFIRFRSCSHKL